MLFVFTLLAFASMPSSAADITSDLVVHWKLDDNTDDSAGSNDGTFTGSPDSVSGKIGGAYSFDGSSEDMTFSASGLPSGAANRTLAAWARPTSTSGGIHHVISYGRTGTGNMFTLSRNGTSAASYTWAGGPLVANKWNAGVWSQIASTYDGTKVRLYFDGVEVANTTQTLTTGTGAGRIASRMDQNYEEWDGEIDDVRVYSRALSADDIHALYVQGGPAAQYYHLQQQ
jgi:hypothetical protein